MVISRWRHQMEKFFASPVNSLHKCQWRRILMFSLICAWINGWVTNCAAGDLRCHRAHYDVTVMSLVGTLQNILGDTKWQIVCAWHCGMHLFLLEESFVILNKISLKFVPNSLTDDESVLVQLMACGRTGDKIIICSSTHMSVIKYI